MVKMVVSIQIYMTSIGLGTGEICILQNIAIFPMNIAIHIAIFFIQIFPVTKTPFSQPLRHFLLDCQVQTGLLYHLIHFQVFFFFISYFS